MQQEIPTLTLRRNRLSLPEGFAHNEHLMLTTGPLCLLLLRPKVRERIWSKFLSDEILQNRTDTEKVRIARLARMLIGNAREVAVSKTRKILVDDFYITSAKLDRTVLFVPHDPDWEAVELWSPKVFSEDKRFLTKILQPSLN